MFKFNRRSAIYPCISAVALFAVNAAAQSGSVAGFAFHQTYHIGFDHPEAWGLKYFTATSLLSGLQPDAPSAEARRAGSVTVGLELGWLPALNAGQERIGFNGTSPEDLNKAPIFARPVIRVTLPHNFTAIIAPTPPFRLFGVTPRLVAFGLEHPIVERQEWAIRLRGYGQLGSVTGAFTCPASVLGFAPGSSGNPTGCVGQSNDSASLRYAGMELQFSHRLAIAPRVVPHVAVGGSFMDGVFQVHAPVEGGLDETRLWTHGGLFSTTGGVTYYATKRAAFTVDAFYSPLWVRRNPTGPITNDGLFNVRAILTYTLR